MAQAGCRWRVNTAAGVQSQTSPRGELWWGKWGTLISFSASISVLPARSKVWVCGHSLAGIVSSNPALSMDVCLLYYHVEVSASG